MKVRHLLLVLLPVLLGSACQNLYIPNGPNVPLMSGGDELQVGMSVGSNGYGAQLAYSPYYHWAIAATGNTFSIMGGSGYTRNQLSFRHLYGEAATGYYTRLSKFARFELLGGYGGGATGHPDDSKHLYRRLFVQPSIGLSSPFIDAGFTPRICFVTHYLDVINGAQSKPNDKGTFFEPTVTLRGGMDEFKFQLQGGLAFPLGDVAFDYRRSFLSMGFHLTFVKDFDKYR
jgi:hypothetical protein